MPNKNLADLALVIAQHQMLLQLLGATWAGIIIGALYASEKPFFRMLEKQLPGITAGALMTAADVAKIKKKVRKITDLRRMAMEQAKQEIMADAMKMVENELHWAKKITSELSPAGGKKTKMPPAKVTSTLPQNTIADGKLVQDYFDSVADVEAIKIEQAVIEGVRSGKTIPELRDTIAGTAKNDFTDGIMETTRNAAVNMARTVCNAVANNAKDAFYQANSDVITGVEILATLDGRTCPICAGLDRTRYPLGKPHPALPVHHQCRCVLLPVTPLSDLVEEDRPMAKRDFMADAKKRYEEKYPNKKWEDLAPSTRKKKYYEEMRRFEKETGEPAYTQVPGGVSFREYFTKYMTPEQQRDWLGPKRYELWKKGNLPLDRFIPPYPNKQLTVERLKELDKKSF